MNLAQLRERLQNLQNELSTAVQNGMQLLDQGSAAPTDQITANNAEVARINAQITAVRNAIAELEGRQQSEAMRQPMPSHLEDSIIARRDEIRASREYNRAFYAAIRNGFRPGGENYQEQYRPLMDVLTIGGGDPAGEQGGFIVPVDLETEITRLINEQNPLRQYFNVENVNTNSGDRPVENAVDMRFEKLSEGAKASAMTEADAKLLRNVHYSLSTYRKHIQMSMELASDATAMQSFLAEKLANAKVATENANLLALLNTMQAETVAADASILDAIKTALTKKLRRAISKRSMILTNASGYSLMELEKDENGRSLLQPNPADAAANMVKGRVLDYVDDADMANLAGGAPVVVGYLKAFGTLFDRGAMELASTTVGGDSWTNYTVDTRAIIRQDYKIIDPTAAVMLALATE